MIFRASWLAVFIILYGSLHLVNYGRWAGKLGNRRGAVGLYLYAIIALAVPIYYLVRASL